LYCNCSTKFEKQGLLEGSLSRAGLETPDLGISLETKLMCLRAARLVLTQVDHDVMVMG